MDMAQVELLKRLEGLRGADMERIQTGGQVEIRGDELVEVERFQMGERAEVEHRVGGILSNTRPSHLDFL